MLLRTSYNTPPHGLTIDLPSNQTRPASDQTVDNVVFRNPNKVVDYSEASSSSFFQESIDLYFELYDLDSDDHSAFAIDAGYMGALQDSEYFVGGVFGVVPSE